MDFYGQMGLVDSFLFIGRRVGLIASFLSSMISSGQEGYLRFCEGWTRQIFIARSDIGKYLYLHVDSSVVFFCVCEFLF